MCVCNSILFEFEFEFEEVHINEEVKECVLDPMHSSESHVLFVYF